MLGFDALGRLALGELTSSAGPSIVTAIAFAAGHGNAYAISYAFFLDGEIVCVQDEPRTTSVSEENRLLIVPWSAREQEAAPSDQNANTLNRKRTC